MKAINVIFENSEMDELKRYKEEGESWREFILRCADSLKELSRR